LYLKVQQLLAHGETHDATPHPIVGKGRPGPKNPNYGIPASQWPTVVHRIVVKKEPLRTVAAAYGVSHETIRRIMLHVQKQGGQQEASLYSYFSYDRGAMTSWQQESIRMRSYCTSTLTCIFPAHLQQVQ